MSKGIGTLLIVTGVVFILLFIILIIVEHGVYA